MRRRALLAGALAAVGMVVGGWAGAVMVTAAAPAAIPAGTLDFPHQAVSFPSASGSRLRGWYAPGTAGHGTVILMHGIRANRLSMASRARFLHRAGYAVLLFDFQAHGESPGERLTFGHLEARDARAALDFSRGRTPGEPAFAIGTSLGGAAALLGDGPLPLDGLVLEAVYPRIEAAMTNRFEIVLGRVGRWIAPALLMPFLARVGASRDELAPVEAIRRLRCPVLVIAGAVDRHTPPAESRELFAAAPEPKQLWIVDGAAHVDFHRHAGAAYEARVLEFLQKSRGAPRRSDGVGFS